MTTTVPTGFDASNKAHIDAALRSIAERGHGTGWEVQSFSPEEGKLTLIRRGLLNQVAHEGGQQRGTSYRVELRRGVKPSDGEQIAAELESDPAHAGFFMTRFDPFLAQATLSKLTAEQLRARGAIATVLGVKPWDVQVTDRPGGGFLIGLPPSYIPSKHDEKLDEIVQAAIGETGWYFRGNASKLTGEVVPSKPATFPPSIPYPMDSIPQPGTTTGLPPIPFGLQLPTRGDQEPDMLYLDLEASPHMQLGGTSGAGKACSLDTPIPTPDGWTTMGDLKVGDTVFGRDGEPCRVTFLSNVDETPDLYRITFSDGQVVDADADHQWVVSTMHDRNARSGNHRVAAAVRAAAQMRAAHSLRHLAETYDESDRLPRDVFASLVLGVVGVPWSNADSVESAVKFMGVPIEIGLVEIPRTVGVPRPYDTRRALKALDARFSRSRPGSRLHAWSKSTNAVLRRSDLPESSTLSTLVEELADEGATFTTGGLARFLKLEGVAPILTGREKPARVRRQFYPVRRALVALAERIEFVTGEGPSLEQGERVMTTAEMLSEGVTVANGRNFAVRVAGAIQLPEADLPVPAYTLGAWLGDGVSRAGSVVSMDPEVVDHIVSEGFPVRQVSNAGCGKARKYIFDGLMPELRKVMRPASEPGKLDKSIPELYLRASVSQRLAVLQGLMDTDGTVSPSGGCELSLNKRDLAHDALELIRSLGIRASMTAGESSYVVDGRKSVTGTRYRIHFTTDMNVFRLPRKLARVPAVVRETQRWIYVVSIEKIESRAARCIQVDSPDSTYLAAGFVPTHNTVSLNNLIAGALAGGAELAIADVPQKAIDFESWRPFVRPGGWGCESFQENAIMLEQLYREGEQRAATLKRYGAKKLSELPADMQSRMRPVLIVVDEVTGLFAPEMIPKALPQDHPLRLEAESRTLAKELIKSYIEKIAAEQRFVGYKLVLSTQVASTATGIGTALRTNLGNKALLGARATDGNRKLILRDPTSVPPVPDHVKDDAQASRGVGVAEFEGQEACVFKSFYASERELISVLVTQGLSPHPQTQLDSITRPDPKAVHAMFPELAQIAQAKAEEDAPVFNDSDRPLEAWEVDPETGKPLTGYARANAARHALAGGAK